jgi:hypothetical protein
LIPNAHRPSRTILAFSGTVNDDNDFYFDDPLFPRVDEDPGKDMTQNDKSGISGVDDDGDDLIDEFGKEDDDEDGVKDEDPLDGVDNDGDGNIDEDLHEDTNRDGKSGIKGMDDDGDGSVDEAGQKDDDEDGKENEDPLNPLVFSWNSSTRTLTESLVQTGKAMALSTHVTLFRVTYEAPQRILIELTLTAEDGESVEFVEYVYPRNTFQKTGKRVR